MRSRLLKTALIMSAAAPVAADFAFGQTPAALVPNGTPIEIRP